VIQLALDMRRQSQIDAAFSEFHARNPHVYARLAAMARQAVAAGRRRIGIGMLFEVLRWEHQIATTDEEFRLNNNYRSRYAFSSSASSRARRSSRGSHVGG
jgi:hypothetical protein